MALSKKQRAVLFAMFGGLCAYCGQPLPEKGWHADHLEPVQREWWKALRNKTTAKWDETKQCVVQVETDRKVTMGYPERDTFENHLPACAPCNIDKGSHTLEAWRKSLEQRVEVCRRNHSAFRFAERFGLVAQIKTAVVFHFEEVKAEEAGNGK